MSQEHAMMGFSMGFSMEMGRWVFQESSNLFRALATARPTAIAIECTIDAEMVKQIQKDVETLKVKASERDQVQGSPRHGQARGTGSRS